MLKITNNFLKQLGVICAAHLENDRPDGSHHIFERLLLKGDAILAPLLSCEAPELKPLRDLSQAYNSDTFPKLILVEYSPPGAIGHVFSIKIEDLGENTYNIIILESLSQRSIQSCPRALSEKCETYQINATPEEIQELIQKVSGPGVRFRDERELFAALLHAIPNKSSVRREDPEGLQQLMTVLSQRQGTCQGKTFTNSLLSFCPNKEQYKVLKALIQSLMINHALNELDLNQLNFRELSLINEAIYNLERNISKNPERESRIKHLAGQLGIELNHSPIGLPTIMTRPLCDKPEDAEFLPIETTQKTSETSEYMWFPHIDKSTTTLHLPEGERISAEEKRLRAVHIITNKIQHGLSPLNISFDRYTRSSFLYSAVSMGEIRRTHKKDYHNKIIYNYQTTCLIVLEFLETALALLRKHSSDKWTPERQFIIEQFLSAITHEEIVDSIHIASQLSDEDIHTNSMSYNIIWKYIYDKISSLSEELGRNKVPETEFREHDTLLKMQKIPPVRVLKTDHDYGRYEKFPLSNLALSRVDFYATDITPGLDFASIMYHINTFRRSWSSSYLGDSIDFARPYEGRTLHNEEIKTQGFENPFDVMLSGLSYKQSGCLNLDQIHNPIIANLLRLSYSEHDPNHALNSIVSYVCGQATNIIDSIESASDNFSTVATNLCYIDKLITRGTALDAEINTKIACMNMLLNAAREHLSAKRYMAHSLCLDTANTLLHHFITKDPLYSPDYIRNIEEQIRSYTDCLLSDYDSDTILSRINSLDNTYSHSVIKVFYMLLSTTSAEDISRIQAIFIHQALLNLHPYDIEKRASHHQKMLMAAPLLRADQDLGHDQIAARQDNIEHLLKTKLPRIELSNTPDHGRQSKKVVLSINEAAGKKEYSPLYPQGLAKAVLGDHYLAFVKKPHLAPIEHIQSYLNISLTQDQLTLRDNVYYFTYKDRQYSLDPSGVVTLYQGDTEYTLQSSNSDFCVFVSGATKILVAPNHPMLPANISRLQLFSRSFNVTTPMLRSLSYYKHPWLQEMGHVYINHINQETDEYLFAKTDLLLSATEHEFKPVNKPQYRLPRELSEATQQELSFFPLEAAGLQGYLPFLDAKGALKLICLYNQRDKSHAFFNVKGHILEPESNEDFLYLFNFLVNAPYSKEAAMLCYHASQFFLGTAQDAEKTLKEIINVFDAKSSEFNPYWYYVLDAVLTKTPQFVPPVSIGNIIQSLYQLLPNIPNIHTVKQRFAALYTGQNEVPRVWKTTTAIASYQPPMGMSFDPAKPAETIANMFDQIGIMRAAYHYDHGAPCIVYQTCRSLQPPNHRLTPYLFTPPKTSDKPLVTVNLPDCRYSTTPAPLMAPLMAEPTQPTILLSDKIQQSIEMAQREIDAIVTNKNDYMSKLYSNDNITTMMIACGRHIRTLTDSVEAIKQSINNFIRGTYDASTLLTGKIDITDASHNICYDKLVKIGAHSTDTLTKSLGLSYANADALKAELQKYLWANCELRHHQNIQDALKALPTSKSDANDTLYKLMSEPRHLNPSDPENYALLQYEYFSGFRARGCQISLYNQIATNTQFIAELKPGSGKTSIIPAIAANESLKGKQVIIELPLPMYATQALEIAQKINSLYGLECYHLKTMPEGTLANLRQLNQELDNCKRDKRVILATVQSIQSVRLQLMRMVPESSYHEQAHKLEEFLNSAYYISDEIDSEFSPRRVVNIPLGSKLPADTEIQALIANAMRVVAEHSDKITLAGTATNFHGTLPTDTYATDEDAQALISEIQAKYPNIDPKIINFIGKYYKVIFISQNNYAASLDGSNEAVPAIGGVAIHNATFSDMITKLVTTWLTHFRQGMCDKKLFELIKILAQPIIRDNTAGLIRRTRLDKINLIFGEDNQLGLSDESKVLANAIVEQSASISGPECPFLKNTYHHVLQILKRPDATQIITLLFQEYITSIIFPTVLSNHTKVSLGPFDHPRGQIVGLTGTTHSLPALQMTNDMPINHRVTGPLAGDGVCLSRMFSEEASGNLRFISYRDFAELETFFRGSPKYQAIIDNAKFISTPDTEAYARKIATILPESWGVTCVLFFINSNFYGLHNGKIKQISTTTRADIESTMGVTMDQCFMIFDSARTRGCDVPLPIDARGLLTLSMNTSLADTIQSIMRFRQFGIGQKIDIVPSPELGRDLEGKLNIQGLIENLIARDTQDMRTSDNISSAHQAIKAVCINTVRDQYAKCSVHDKERMFDLLKELTTNQSELSPAMFDGTLGNTETAELLQSVGRQYLSKLQAYIDRIEWHRTKREIDAIIQHKIQVCAPVVTSVTADTSSQSEVAASYAVAVVNQYNFDQVQPSVVEPNRPLAYYHISELHPDLRDISKKLLISHDAFHINNRNSTQAAHLPNCYIALIEDGHIAIVSPNDLCLLRGYQVILAGDFETIANFADAGDYDTFNTLCLAVTCLGSALGLAQHLAKKENLKMPPFAKWAKKTINPCNRINSHLLELLSSNELTELTNAVAKHKGDLLRNRGKTRHRLSSTQLQSIAQMVDRNREMILFPEKFLAIIHKWFDYIRSKQDLAQSYKSLCESPNIRATLKLDSYSTWYNGNALKWDANFASILSENSLQGAINALNAQGLGPDDISKFEKYIARKKICKELFDEIRLSGITAANHKTVLMNGRRTNRIGWYLPKIFNIAAIKIQTGIRGLLARRERDRRSAAIITFQSAFRGLLARKELARKNKAATKIQAVYRGLLARRELARKNKAATKIQAVYRGFLARRELARRKEAATKIQAVYRGLLARRELARKNKAATKIQAGIRGYLARKELARKNKAATKIQAGIRGYRARKELARKNKAATKIQAGFRGYRARKELARKNKSATKIQAVYRGFLARRELARRKEAATKIQAGIRGLLTRRELARRELARRERAIITVQSAFRGLLARRERARRELARRELAKIKLAQKVRKTNIIKLVAFNLSVLIFAGLLTVAYLYLPTVTAVVATVLIASILLSIFLTKIPLLIETPIQQLKSWRLKRDKLKQTIDTPNTPYSCLNITNTI